MRPRLLDLFCGAGGAAMGYHRAGFEVVGVDLEPQPRYPFTFAQMDALEVLERIARHGVFTPAVPISRELGGFVAIHASPPCPLFSSVTPAAARANHPDLIAPTRDLLQTTGLRYVIENVERAPLRDPVRLCGTSFAGLRVIRHRLFETNWPLMVPPCAHHPLLYMPDKRRPHQAALDETVAYVSVTGGGNCSKAAASDAMGIDWMTKDELNQAIPPAYTELIGRALLAI